MTWPQTIDSPIHPWVGVSLHIINLQTELNYLDSVNNSKIFSVLTWPHPLTHPPSHPPNHRPTHGWGSLHRFQIFKRNWNISISSSAIEFWLIPGVPPWGMGVGGWGWVWWVGAPHTHAQTCTCMHTHVWHHKEFPGISPMGATICMKLSCLPCMHVHVCACAHVWGVPPNHQPPLSSPHPTPRAAGNPKHQNSITLELIEIIQFCLKILYLWTFLNS